jgi:hypothetical protein
LKLKRLEGYVIDQWRNPEAIKIAQSDDDRMARIRKIADEMRHLQEQKNEALRMKLRGEVDARTFRVVTAEIDAVHDQLAREHKRLASEAAMPELPDPSLAWEDLSAEHRRALTEVGLLLIELIMASGIDRALSTALALWRKPLAVRDSGKILLDLAITLVLGGDCLADVNLLRCESGVFGGSPRIRRCRG